MRTIKVALLAGFVFACQSSGTRRVSGTLVAAHPSDTSVVAVGSNPRPNAAVASDGSFSLELPVGSTYRLYVVTHRAGHTSALGTVTSHGRPIKINARLSNRAVSLGRIGSPQQQLTMGDPSQDCSGPGESLETEHDADEGPDAGETEGKNDDLDDGGEHHSHNDLDDGGEHDSHDDLCEGDEHEDAGDKDDGKHKDAGHEDRGGDH
jgi:hypothetical protein